MATASVPFRAGAAGVAVSQVEISVSCRNLKDKDVFSKSDPMVVLFIKETTHENWKEVGRTEVIENNLNPNFVKKFLVDYYFEERQQLLFKAYDIDSKGQELKHHDFLGQVKCTLGELVAHQGSQIKLPLAGLPGDCGSVLLSVEEVGSCRKIIHMQWLGHKLDKKDFFGKSDPFLEFYRTNEDNSFTAVFRTEVIKKSLNPIWRPFTIQMRQLCGGDEDRLIKVICYDWDFGGGHDLIGEFYSTVKTFTLGPGPSNEYELINPKKQAKKKKYKNSGLIKLMSFSIYEQPTFLDYIRGGMQMHFTVAVDFTASNGSPLDPMSLHYMDPSNPNAYIVAIKAVGEIIQDYDYDKLFPALGFGARLPPDGRVSHEFYLNGHPSNPYCAGVEGILEAYQRTLHSVQLYGPTNFAPVINHVAKFAREHRDGTHYFVLLIITDGIISDMPQTKEAIVQAASLPMSIIIVGVGNADFAEMEVLDGDTVRLSSRGREAERDIVQFVPFNKFLQGSVWQRSQIRLAKEVLAEIPDQVTSYMLKRNIKPNPPVQDPSAPVLEGDPPPYSQVV